MANSRIRSGKAYEHIVLGLLTKAGFDAYHPVVDDQGIDGVIRVAGTEGSPTKYYDLQIKGSKNWGGIRCKINSLSKRGVLILYCANKHEILWFQYKELPKLFRTKSPQWGDIFLNKELVSEFKFHGRDQLSELLKLM